MILDFVKRNAKRLSILLAIEIVAVSIFLFAAYKAKADLVFEPTAGVEYEVIDPPLPSQRNGGKVEVVEMFCYGCKYCFNMEAHLDEWLKTKHDIAFRKQPAVFFPWMPNVLFKAKCTHYAKTFFTADKLGVVDKINKPLFDAIYKQDQDLANEKAMMSFVRQAGIDPEAFKDIYNSGDVQAKVGEAEKLTAAADIDTIPAFVVDGKYWTSSEKTATTKDMFAVLDYLIKKAAAERGLSYRQEAQPRNKN